MDVNAKSRMYVNATLKDKAASHFLCSGETFLNNENTPRNSPLPTEIKPYNNNVEQECLHVLTHKYLDAIIAGTRESIQQTCLQANVGRQYKVPNSNLFTRNTVTCFKLNTSHYLVWNSNEGDIIPESGLRHFAFSLRINCN